MTAAGFCENCGGQVVSGSKFCHQCGIPIAEPGIEKPPLSTEKVPLYHVFSTVNNFRFKDIFYDNLKISWFISDRDALPIPPEKAILNYSALGEGARGIPENYLKERFTLAEAEALKVYLTSVQKVDATIEPCRLPIPDSERGFGDIPESGGINFISLFNKARYDLPFKVMGCFNLNLADERVVSDDRVTQISKVTTEDLKKYAKEKKDKQE